ncbi:MAG: single-stranded DNA-binding protein [Ardenticatenaceae bacterium]|nr:single-stranded DNA-binding protein [Anaerolineales bacterium]MCB8984817.1 single-stranded DNA-binding protein [Ardenticatenaceae bacterium]
MYQKIIIVGNLGRDPEMRYMPDGTAVTNFSVASSRRWTGQDGQQHEETTWFRIEVWRRQAETVNQYLTKGSKVLVEGRIKPDPNTGGPRLWSRQDGTIGANFEVVADTVRFLSSRSDDGSSYEGGEEYSGAPAQEEDDIPF